MVFLWEKQAAEKTAELLEKLNPDHLPIVQVGETKNDLFSEQLRTLGWEYSKEEKPFCALLLEPEKADLPLCRARALPHEAWNLG